MPQNPIADIEAAIERGQLAEARQLLQHARGLPEPPQGLDELRQRLAEVEHIALPRQIAGLTHQARDAIGRADYREALTALQSAVELDPNNPALRQELERTREAAERHAQNLRRNQAVQGAADAITQLLDRNELEQARVRLRDAGIELGRHNAFDRLYQRLEELEQKTQRQRSVELSGRVRELFEAGNWRGVLQEAERLLRLEPSHTEALDLYRQARHQLDTEEGKRQRRMAFEEAQRDIERLIEGGELASASRRLESAIHEVGHEDAFVELGRRLERAQSDLKFRQRVEWAERRANEAEHLMHEAQRFTLQGAHDDAVQVLEQARTLDPSHPEIPDRLATAYAARDRQREERQRHEALDRDLQAIRGHLDALNLRAAKGLLEKARQDFDAPDRLAPLETRLERLLAAEQATSRLAQVGSGTLDPRATASLLLDQQELWQAYSWKQAFLFPLRNRGALAFGVLVLVLLGLDALGALAPWLHLLRPIALLATLAFIPSIARATVSGENNFPGRSTLLATQHLAGMGSRAAAMALVVLLPATLWLVAAPWNPALDGPGGWLSTVVLLWPACALWVVAIGASVTFGETQLPRIDRHARALVATPEPLLWIANGAFALLLLWIVVRLTVVPTSPWLGAPLSALLEAYGILASGHLVGVAMRREGVHLATIYAR